MSTKIFKFFYYYAINFEMYFPSKYEVEMFSSNIENTFFVIVIPTCNKNLQLEWVMLNTPQWNLRY